MEHGGTTIVEGQRKEVPQPAGVQEYRRHLTQGEMVELQHRQLAAGQEYRRRLAHEGLGGLQPLY